MFSDLLFVLLAVSAIIFMFSSPKPEKIQSGIAEVVGSNPTSPFLSVRELRHCCKFIFDEWRTNSVAMVFQ